MRTVPKPSPAETRNTLTALGVLVHRDIDAEPLAIAIALRSLEILTAAVAWHAVPRPEARRI